MQCRSKYNWSQGGKDLMEVSRTPVPTACENICSVFRFNNPDMAMHVTLCALRSDHPEVSWLEPDLRTDHRLTPLFLGHWVENVCKASAYFEITLTSLTKLYLRVTALESPWDCQCERHFSLETLG